MNSFKKTILKNTLWLTLSQIIGNLVGYILIVAIARNLGDVGLGQYSFIFAFTGLTFIFADMGLGYLMMKEVSRDEKKSQYYFENLFSLKIFLGILLGIITIIISLFLGKDAMVVRSIWIVAIISFFNVINYFFSQFFIGINRMDLEATSNILERISALIFGLYFLYTQKSLIFLVIALLIAMIIRTIFLTFNIRNKVKFKFKINIKLWKEIIIEALPFFFTGVFIYIYFRIDTVMLFLMKGDEVTGWYNAAYKLIDVLSVFPVIIIMAIFPSMSKLYKENKDLLKVLFLRAFRYLVMLALPILIGTIILADRFIEFIYGESFIGSTLSLQILIWAELFVFVNYLIGNLFNSIDKQKYFMIITGVCAVFNIILNFILIPKYSYVGAGVATVLTEILNFFLLRKYLGDFLLKLKINFVIIKSLIAALIMGVFVYYFKWLALWYVVPLGAIVYIIVLFLLKLEKEDKELIIEMINYLKTRLFNSSK